MMELSAHYIAWLVVASVATSIAAAYAALMLADRMRAAATVWQRRGWLLEGSVALGGGIWSMHYLGMLAVKLPFEIDYHWPTVALSGLLAIPASAVVLQQIGHRETTQRRLAVSALLMAAGIAAMHYTGMAAMRSRAMEVYGPWGVVLAVCAAAVFAWIALAVAARAANSLRGGVLLRRLLAATLMGTGIAAMHYTAMATVRFRDMGAPPDLAHTLRVGLLGEWGVALVTAVVLIGTLAGAAFDERRIRALGAANQRLAAAHQELRSAHEQLSLANEQLRLSNEELQRTQAELLRTQASLCDMNQSLNELSIRDGLTGVFNRRHFDRMLDTEFRRAARRHGPIALIMVDLDYFKKLNDTFGHQYGDACLRLIAEMLQDVPKRGYDLVARYGGEEFAVLLPEAEPEGARQKAEEICERARALRVQHPADPQAQGHISVSVGLCICWPGTAQEPLELLQQADAALYRAKEAGRDRVVSVMLLPPGGVGTA